MKLGFFSSIITDGNPKSGFEIANEAIVTGLRDLGHEVSVIGFQLPRQILQDSGGVHVLETLNVENSEASGMKKLEWLARSKFFGLPVSAAKLTVVSAKKLEQTIDQHGPFDGHIINSHQMAAAFPALLKKPYAYVAHNVEYRSAGENALSAASVLKRYFYRRDERLLRVLEGRLCEHARYVWALSEEDLVTHEVSPTGGGMLPLITPIVECAKAFQNEEWDVGLIGTWSWQPNFVGLKWFLENIVPQLPKEFRIAVAGSVPEGVVSNHPRVKFLGRVKSASEFLQSVRVIPLVSQGGTGVQLKTIEAFQSGYSCIATSSSVRGIDCLPRNCLRTDAVEEFSQGLITLVENSLNKTLPEVNGNEFYRRQRAAMMDSLDRGVQKLA